MTYQYNSTDLLRNVELSPQQEHLLKQSKTFCILPWIHLHAYPTGEVWPCCAAEHDGMRATPLGNSQTTALVEIWNSERMRELRNNMLNDREDSYCTRCYEREENGFWSDRRGHNKHHGHHINKIEQTQPDGSVPQFEMSYWDIRFSNLCNLRCRSCGHIFSSQWYQDQIQLSGPEYRSRPVLNIAGRSDTDMWEQLQPHLDYVEQIYFAGGEPLLMEEHYRILDELDRRGMYYVRLIYNTNFTHTDLKGRSVFDYWKKFESVAVGASLDAEGARAEYIRKGTDWERVVQNRKEMMKICPEVDFYISPTLSILNLKHLPEFHRNWVEAGLIQAQDLNINILQDPAHYRIDIATNDYKDEIEKIYRQHIEWLRPQDKLQRATVGFESAINYMRANDKTNFIDQFWRKTHELDDIRNENLLSVIPELKALL